MKKNNLRVFDLKNSKINNGNTRYFIAHDNSKYKTKLKISKFLRRKKFKLKKKKLSKFYRLILSKIR